MGQFRKHRQALTREQRELVERIKTKAEELMAVIRSTPDGAEPTEVMRQENMALAYLETCVMWATKAATVQPKETDAC